ncbi:MAG: EipB family protein [Bdellovibrionales bacterium]
MAQSAAAGAELAPHKALYDIRLKGARNGSQIVDIKGKMLYEWGEDCDGWNTKHRFDILYEYADSPAMRITSDFSNFESYDSESLNFVSTRKKDGQPFEAVRGAAQIAQNKKGKADYTRPKGLSYDLPAGTLFPTAHSMDVLKAIKAGRKFHNAVIFDGSDEDGPVEVNTFIGAKIEAPLHDPAGASIDQALLQSPAHKVRLAFFPLKDRLETADYEMSLTLLENSVITDMSIDYDDFTIHQSLIALEPVAPACDAKHRPDPKSE